MKIEDSIAQHTDAPRRESSFVELLDQILDAPHVDKTFASILTQAREHLNAPLPASAPFLSVLLRTQGRRIEPLKDALLCLAAQTDQDFEIIVIDHDADADGAASVRAIVDAQPLSVRERIRILEVKGGGRSAPLNAGVRAARGEFFAVYDDDDLLFANWVEAFRGASLTSSGRMLRAVSATQRVETETWPQGQAGFRTLSWPNAEYAQAFDAMEHMRVNHSPFMSLAFPRQLFTHFGLAFDDELSVCEDWDLILRGSSLSGVDDIQELTSVYRRWERGQSSYTAHSLDSWRDSERRVIGRMNESVVLMPQGTVQHVRELLEVKEEGEAARLQLIHLTQSRAWRWAKPVRAAVRFGSFGKRVVRKVRRTLLPGR